MNREMLIKKEESLLPSPSFNILQGKRDREDLLLKTPSQNEDDEKRRKEDFFPKTVDTTPSVVTPIDQTPLPKLSKKEFINNERRFNDILQYREDRFGTDKKEGTSNLLLGFIKGDLNQENLVDDYLDHYRFITSNEIDVATELDWLKSVKKKEEVALTNAKNATVKNDEDRYLAEANKFSEIRKRAARLYRDTARLGELYESKRYEGMSTYEKVADVVDTIGGHIAANISSPLTVVSVGVGKKVASELAKKTGIGTISQVLIAAATTAPIDAVQAGVVDVLAQGSEIEMGLRKEYDAKRTAQVAGVSAAVSGTLSGIGQRLSLRKGSGLSEDSIENSVKKVKAEQQKVAQKKIKELGDQSKEFSESFAKDIEATFGKDAVIKNSKGKIININEDVIKKAGREKIEALDDQLAVKKEAPIDILEPALNFNTFQRVLAGVSEIFVDGKKRIDDFIDMDKEGVMRIIGDKDYISTARASLTNALRPLSKDERISSRVFELLQNDYIKKDPIYEILAKYGVTHKDFSAMMLSHISRAGQTLAEVSKLPRQLARGNKMKTADEVDEDLASTVTSNAYNNLYYKLENIRRGTLVSGVATAVRNGLAQIPRAGIDTLGYMFETIINPSKRKGFKATFAHLNYTFANTGDSVAISNAILKNFDVQTRRMWNQYSEVGHQLRKRNPNQHALSNVDVKKTGKTEAPEGLGRQKEGFSVLDKWEGLIHTFNVFNRFQESVFRRGAFTASMHRQMAEKGEDLVKRMEDGTFMRYMDDDMVKKAVDNALDFTFASNPEFNINKKLNKLLTDYGTLAIPFPRFMFKAMEMTYNYSPFGLTHSLIKLVSRKVRGKGFTKAESDREFKRVAQALSSAPLIYLGYELRDPENDVAGTDWYKLKDGKGNEIDTRVYGPIITPYLLLGEYIHRMNGEGRSFGFKDFVEGLTGANFRNMRSVDKTIAELLDSLQGEEFSDINNYAAAFGKTIGEAATGFGQFFLQFGDFRFDSDRRRDYRENPIYDSGMDAFMKELTLPFKRRIDAFTDDPTKPFARDPRVTDIPERVLPFMKVLFGATLNRTPPDYILELGLMGFDYQSFMAKTPMADINRLANKKTAEFLQQEMPVHLDNLKGDERYQSVQEDGTMKYDRAKSRGNIDSFIKSIKKQALAEAKAEIADNSTLEGLLMRYRGINPDARISAQKIYKALKEKEIMEKYGNTFPLSDEDLEPDFNNYDELFQLYNIARTERKQGETLRNLTPSKQKKLLTTKQ